MIAANRVGLRGERRGVIPVALAQAVKYDTNASALTQTFNLDSAIAAGQVIVLTIFEAPSSNPVTGVSGLGATWTQVVRQANTPNSGQPACSIWKGVGPTAGGTAITITSTSARVGRVYAMVWNGLTGTTVLTDQQSQQSQFPQSGAGITPTAVDQVFIGMFDAGNFALVTETSVPAGGLTHFSDGPGYMAYRIVTSLVLHLKSCTAGGARQWSGCAVILS